MITRWGIKNFKSVKEAEVDFTGGGLTVLTGTNSAGKSSLNALLHCGGLSASPLPRCYNPVDTASIRENVWAGGGALAMW